MNDLVEIYLYIRNYIEEVKDLNQINILWIVKKLKKGKKVYIKGIGKPFIVKIRKDVIVILNRNLEVVFS